MKYYPVKKQKERTPVKITEIRSKMPKPKLPLVFVKKIHKSNVYVEFVYVN